MENRTVTLPLAEYNELRDFKRKITEGHTYVEHIFGSKYISTEEAVANIAAENDALRVKIEKLETRTPGVETSLPTNCTCESFEKYCCDEAIAWIVPSAGVDCE